MTPAIGLTGRIGSGKSSAAACFAELGVPVLDLDEVGRGLLSDAAIADQLCAAFGDEVVVQGAVQRQMLAAHAFADRASLTRLEGILHPSIWQQAMTWLGQQAAHYAIIEASALRHHSSSLEGIIEVVVDRALRRQRVLVRGRQSDADFVRIDRLQSPPPAAYSLNNNGAPAELQQQVAQLHLQLLSR
ncbi:MAG: dephospho-CoA kinase [Mariprofundales bacterium]|nr:dephospho-CoA kinase [Mariprofundales bacterium]